MARLIHKVDDYSSTLRVEEGWSKLYLDINGEDIELDKYKVQELIEELQKAVKRL